MRTERQNKHVTFMQMAQVLSKRSTCARRAVGCILVDSHNHIIGSGYNGNAAGLPHCIDSNCAGANSPSGSDLDICEAIHAEQNTLMQCTDIHKIVSCYVTTFPCMHCLKMLMNTSCKNLYYMCEYTNMIGHKIWTRSGRILVRIDLQCG